MEKKALGKGIGALIPSAPAILSSSNAALTEVATITGNNVTYLPVALIKPNPLQPRDDFNPQSLEELTQSIKEKGILQPILVRKQGEAYELIAGERRYRAANLLNLKEIPVIVRNVDDRDSLELALIENIQRENLNVIEEARAYKYLVDKFSVTQEELSDVLGKARATVANILRLLKLPQEIQEEIKKGRISYAHGRALLEVQDVNQQRKLVQDIISKGLSVRELETLLKSGRSALSLPRRRLKQDPAAETTVSVLEEELQHILATKVRIVKKKKRGSIIIEFYSAEDMKRLSDKIRQAFSS
ncbi:MAG: ParB/RepB/Spo0J family partition protein [Candidatus Omnitrophota bacterium]|jgi:ParB family chromosome partitioning protein